MPSADEITQTTSFQAFVQEARHFCGFIEQDSTPDQPSFLQHVQTHLQQLYLFGKALPLVDLYFDEDFPDTLAKSTAEEIAHSISQRLAANRFYWHVYDPSDSNNGAPVCGDLLDDILSVYQDVKNPLLLFDTTSPSAVECAICSFRSNFTIHWGDHCSNAIYALHYFIQRAG
jgi:hypothetical protein